MLKWLALAGMTSLAACAAGSAPPGEDPCVGFRPILVDPRAPDRLTIGEQEQIVAHNEYGEANCGW